jgi:hypothetical protein
MTDYFKSTKHTKASDYHAHNFPSTYTSNHLRIHRPSASCRFTSTCTRSPYSSVATGYLELYTYIRLKR